MNKSKFEILKLVTSGNALLERARKTLTDAQSEKVRELSGRIPATMSPPDRAVEVVFAGQYSAGKSSILKTLTGRDDIAIGAAITTQDAHTYEWDGIQVIDTPGVHTQLRPDHDEISYRAIADADLLVFVVTNELFDSHLAQHFRKLAIERDKVHEMMLVVNKMRRCVKGNSPDMQAIIREDLRKVLTPFSPEDFRISFIDAEAALESALESNTDIAAALWRKSGIDLFTQELNRFVRERGLTGRYSTALYNLEQILQEALCCESSGDKDVDALEELLLQRRRALMETQERIPRAVEGEIQRIGTEIRDEGRKLAELVHGKADQKAVDTKLKEAQARVQLQTEKLGHSIQETIIKHMKALDERVGAISESELAKELFPRLSHRIEETKISSDTMGKLKTAAEISQKLGGFLIKNSFTSKGGGLAGLFRLNQYSGTAAHETVKTIGHFFGKSFKPWEAVKWTKGIANAGRVLAVAGTVLTFVLQYKEDADAANLEIELRNSRAAIRSGFNNAAHTIEMHYDQATASYVTMSLSTEIESVDKQLIELRDMQQSRSDLFQSIIGLLDDTRKMIRDLHTKADEI